MYNFNQHTSTTNIYNNVKNLKIEEYKNHDLLSLKNFEKAQKEISSWHGYKKTSLINLEHIAKETNVAKIYYKDESTRFGLKSFKALGGAYAVANLLLAQLKLQGINANSKDLLAQTYKDITSEITVSCATDGNHGRSVAWAAQMFSCKCEIFIHSHVSKNRENAIAKYGAVVNRIKGNYDDSVILASKVAKEKGYFTISDTSYVGYTEVPKDVMQGYTIMVDEAIKQINNEITHVFLQGGVGGMAAAVVSFFHETYGKKSPIFVIVEPKNAACLLESAKNGKAITIQGELETIMAGLSCGEISTVAWEILKNTVSSFISISDETIPETMKLLANNSRPIIAGESAVAGLAGFLISQSDKKLRKELNITETSKILFFGTEGDTDEEMYEKLVGEKASEIINPSSNEITIDEKTLLKQIEVLGNIGKEEKNKGRTRIALSPDEKLGRDQVVTWMKELELDIKIDKIGNIFATLASNTNEKPLMIGSHIDTVKNAGALDGCYGVLAGLAVIRSFRNAKITPLRPITVAAFTNEEGVRYQPDMMGSLVFAKGLDLQVALNTKGIDGTILKDELKKINYYGDFDSSKLVPYKYLELHIEQGPILDTHKKDIGVVINLQGISWQKITIEGKANHAGTTPTNLRHDAGLVSSLINVFLRTLALENKATLATIGSIEMQPNVINVIPRKVVISVDLRNPNEKELLEAEEKLTNYLKKLEKQENVKISTSILARFEPVQFDKQLAQEIEESACKLGFSNQTITSGAGHDAQMVSRIAPSAMIFVPSRDGISHNPLDYTSDEHLIKGAQVLLDVTLKNIK